MAATDPAGIAAQDLPAAVDAAISDAGAEFGSWPSVQAGNARPAAERPGRRRAMHEAALPLETDWTPQLRAAFTALAACGVIATAPAPDAAA